MLILQHYPRLIGFFVLYININLVPFLTNCFFIILYLFKMFTIYLFLYTKLK